MSCCFDGLQSIYVRQKVNETKPASVDPNFAGASEITGKKIKPKKKFLFPRFSPVQTHNKSSRHYCENSYSYATSVRKFVNDVTRKVLEY